MLQLHPLERIINVHWEDAQDFVITGSVGANASTLQSFLIYSKNGRKWTRLPTAQLPPNHAGLLVYGSGAWLAIGGNDNTIRRSLDKFTTWETVAPFPNAFPGADFACYGKPAKEAPNPPLDDNGDPIRKGVFVALGNGTTEFSICSSLDRGKTWTINKTVSKAEFDFDQFFLTFANERFFVCAAGRDNNNGGFSGGLGPAVPNACKLYTSEDGVTWDDGHDILAAVTGVTWGSELELTDPSEFHVDLFPYGLVYKKKSKRYVISGEMTLGSGRNLFYAESSSTSFGGNVIGDQTLLLSSIGHSVDPETGNATAGGSHGDYYLVNVPSFAGGNIAAVGDSSVIAAQTYLYSESSVTFPTGAGPTDEGQTTSGYLVIQSDQEGVLTPSFSQNYFCGGTFARSEEVGTDFHDEPIVHHLSFSEAGPAKMAANKRKQPNADDDSPGTFLWVRGFANEQIEPPITNRGMEVRISSDGSSFSVVSTPINGTIGTFFIALGATPNPPADE